MEICSSTFFFKLSVFLIHIQLNVTFYQFLYLTMKMINFYRNYSQHFEISIARLNYQAGYGSDQ